jgi:hypothetical protein
MLRSRSVQYCDIRGYNDHMSDGPAKRIRVQFKLAALFVLTAVVGASLALARLLAPLDAQFVDIFLVELAPPLRSWRWSRARLPFARTVANCAICGSGYLAPGIGRGCRDV